MALWYCRCGTEFETPGEEVVAECPECGRQIYFSPSYGNFDGFAREGEKRPRKTGGITEKADL